MTRQALLRMAGQIESFFAGYGPDVAAAEIAEHINRFWAPRMRQAFLDELARDTQGFSAQLQQAASAIKPG